MQYLQARYERRMQKRRLARKEAEEGSGAVPPVVAKAEVKAKSEVTAMDEASPPAPRKKKRKKKRRVTEDHVSEHGNEHGNERGEVAAGAAPSGMPSKKRKKQAAKKRRPAPVRKRKQGKPEWLRVKEARRLAEGTLPRWKHYAVEREHLERNAFRD